MFLFQLLGGEFRALGDRNGLGGRGGGADADGRERPAHENPNAGHMARSAEGGRWSTAGLGHQPTAIR